RTSRYKMGAWISICFSSRRRQDANNRQKILNDHNQYRARHHANPLKLTTALNKSAQAYANQLARNDAGLKHSGTEYGENLALGQPVENVTSAWYDEVANYNFQNGGFSSSTGHFTAIVWKSTTSMGVGIARSKTGRLFIVAQYSPAGNVTEHFAENVLPAN
ncbi:hypothetical protein PFISCL1PPCAC_7329, partial [Pristionchus fissidentatus]